MKRRLAIPAGALLVALVVVTYTMLAVFRVTDVRAVTVAQCNGWWIAGTLCPSPPGGPRHTYYGGDAASASGSGTLYHEWYVAYASSNASSVKYRDIGPVGSVLNSYFPNNSELLRGYAIHSPYNGNLFGNGQY